MAQYQVGSPRSELETLVLVLTYIWKKDVATIFKVPRAPHNVNPAGAITWLVGEQSLLLFLNNNPPTPREFFRDKILSKKITWGNYSLNKLLNLNLGGLGPLVVYVFLQLVISMTKQKFYYLLQKYCTR